MDDLIEQYLNININKMVVHPDKDVNLFKCFQDLSSIVSKSLAGALKSIPHNKIAHIM